MKEDILNVHLKLIINACINICPELTAIILYGGYGRDEGSWFQNEHGAWRPYNDYDICIVTEQKSPVNELKNLEKSLAKTIGINWIDLCQLYPKELKSLRPSIKNYDFKNASKVIYGDPAILHLIPDIDASTLPMKEAEILYFTRLYTLLGSLDKKGLDQNLEGEAARFFRNQMAKAVLAVVDVLLLAKGAYDASYRKRVERVGELYSEKKDFLDLSRWALEEKFSPQAPLMTFQEVHALYRSVHRHYLPEMYHALSLRYGERISGPKEIMYCIRWTPITLLKRCYWILMFRELRRERQIAVMGAQIYLAAAWAPECINEKFLHQGIALLRYADKNISTKLNWDEARIEAARLRMEV